MALTTSLLHYYATRLAPTLLSISGHLIGIPIVFGIVCLTKFMIGKKIWVKIVKIWEICLEWMTILSFVSLLLGMVIRLLHSNNFIHSDFVFPSPDEVTRVIGSVFFISTMSLVVLIFGFIWLGYSHRSPIITIPMTESPDSTNIDEIMKYLKIELKKVRDEIISINRNHQQPKSVAAYPLQEITQSNNRNITPPQNIVRNPPRNDDDPMTIEEDSDSRKCVRCGDTWHKSIACPYIKMTCRSCGLRGHKALVCPHIAHTDNKGRVVTRIENRPGSVKMFQRRDRTQGDALDTTGSVVEALHQALRIKARKEKERREKKAKKVDFEEPTPVVEVKAEEVEVISNTRPQKAVRVDREAEQLLLANTLAEILAISESDDEESC